MVSPSARVHCQGKVFSVGAGVGAHVILVTFTLETFAFITSLITILRLLSSACAAAVVTIAKTPRTMAAMADTIR